MAVIAAAMAVVWYGRGRPPVRENRIFLAGLAAVTIGYLACYKILLVLSPTYEFLLWNELPLYPCNLVAILALPAALLRGRIGHILKAFCFYGGIVFTPVAMAMPVNGFTDVPLLSVNAIGFYGFHGLVLILAVSFGTLRVYRPAFRDIPRVLLTLVLLALPVHGVCMLLRATVYPEANYFYTYGLAGNPVLEGLKALIPIPLVYELPLLLVMAALCAVITLLFQGGRAAAARRSRKIACAAEGGENQP